MPRLCRWAGHHPLGKNRLLGRTTAFDIVLAIILGSLLSRAINGDAPVIGTFGAALALVAIHWAIAEVAQRSKRMELLVKGARIDLIRDGRAIPELMHRAEVTDRDLQEAIRLNAHLDDTTQVDRAYLERNGEISVIPRSGQPRIIDIHVQEGVQTVRVMLT